MRSALPRLQQRQFYTRLCLATSNYSTCASLPTARLRARKSSIPCYLHHQGYSRSSQAEQSHTRSVSTASGSPKHGSSKRSEVDEILPSERNQANKSYVDEKFIPQFALAQRKDPEAWIHLLDKFLPVHLRSIPKGGLDLFDTDQAHLEISNILYWARQQRHCGKDILAYMILHGRGKAALHIVSMLLKHLTSRTPPRIPSSPPSNIVWPEMALGKLCDGPIELVSNSNAARESCKDLVRLDEDPRYTTAVSKTRDSTMSTIWSLLGNVVIECVKLPELESSAILKDVMLIIGQVHSLDLVPEHVYTYRLSPLNTTVQRPPILHLVSSRVLTALSDAAWRDQQDQIIEKAASHGVSYKEIGRDPPGGRFRLKVRPLPAEIWLEFILWCCVEGGFTSAGAQIIKTLRRQEEHPWFAVTWSPSSGMSQTAPSIDWDRVQLRHGGSVGLIEGYSREKPFVDVPPLTISTEVVLSLVETSIDHVDRGHSNRGQRLEIVQKQVTDMISFLEPHDLPIGYFNYVAVRLLQTGAFDIGKDVQALRVWYNNLVFMKSLEPARPQQAPQMSYHLYSLSGQSELFAGILQQALDGFVQAGDVHRALETFNQLQQLVDESKLQAIGTFMRHDEDAEALGHQQEGNDSVTRKDFVGSHGHLPLYKLAGLMDLATETGLVGFGQWLLYNDDPDGPLISSRAFRSSTVARVLLRFAALSKDRNLIVRVLLAQENKTLKPTVKLLRARVSTHISLLEFYKALKPLGDLKNAQGGSAGLSTIVHVAATLFRLEHSDIYTFPDPQTRTDTIDRCGQLLDSILAGSFDNRGGDFREDVNIRYRQQVAALIQMFQFYHRGSLAKIAARHEHRYRASNTTNLVRSVFDTFLEAYVDARGAREGVRFFEQFSTTPERDDPSPRPSLTEPDIDIPDEEYKDEDIDEIRSPLQKNLEAPTADKARGSQSFIPFASSFPAHDVTRLDPDVSDGETVPDDDEVDGPPTADISFSVSSPSQFNNLSHKFSSMIAKESVELKKIFEPVVVADLRSLRIIVRRAVQERKERTHQLRIRDPVHGKQPVVPGETHNRVQNTIDRDFNTDWAVNKLIRMGLPPSLIAIEIQQPLEEVYRIGGQQDSSNYGNIPRINSSTGTTRSENRNSNNRIGKLFSGRGQPRRMTEH